MNYYKATIQYDGTNYCGFQWQKDIPTIQNEINESLKRLIDGKITTMGASRTDTGVHAVEQIVKISSEQAIDCESFIKIFNETLPQTIRCLSITTVPGPFRPASDSISKEYRYLFTNTFQSGGVDQKFIANNPYKLNLDLMKECAAMIAGTHDFRNFCSTGSNVKSTVREISFCEMTEVNPHVVLTNHNLFLIPSHLQQCYQLRIEGKGFLKQMVRHLMSALWLVGGGKISSAEFSSLINGNPKTNRLWKVADPRGLFLYKIKY